LVRRLDPGQLTDRAAAALVPSCAWAAADGMWNEDREEAATITVFGMPD
jgi:hypothetical protein